MIWPWLRRFFMSFGSCKLLLFLLLSVWFYRKADGSLVFNLYPLSLLLELWPKTEIMFVLDSRRFGAFGSISSLHWIIKWTNTDWEGIFVFVFFVDVAHWMFFHSQKTANRQDGRAFACSRKCRYLLRMVLSWITTTRQQQNAHCPTWGLPSEEASCWFSTSLNMKHLLFVLSLFLSVCSLILFQTSRVCTSHRFPSLFLDAASPPRSCLSKKKTGKHRQALRHLPHGEERGCRC